MLSNVPSTVVTNSSYLTSTAMSSGMTPSFLNDPFLLSAAAVAASHSYPPPTALLSSLATSNLVSSINAHLHSITVPSSREYDEQKELNDQQTLSSDVKNLIGSSLTAIGFDTVDENDFDKPLSNETLGNDDPLENFERATTPATNNASPTQLIPTSSTISRPMNIPHSFSSEYFSYSSSAKSPFDAANALFEETLGSVRCCHSFEIDTTHDGMPCLIQPIDTPFPEPSTSNGSNRPGELYKMAGFSQDLPTASNQFQSSSPQSINQRFGSVPVSSLTSFPSASDVENIRFRMQQFQAIALNEKEVCIDDHHVQRVRLAEPCESVSSHRNSGVVKQTTIVDEFFSLNKKNILPFNSETMHFNIWSNCNSRFRTILDFYQTIRN
jgi:hypothetical protein